MKLGFRRILDFLYTGQFGYNSADSEPISMNSG